jgi:hypothetical protein
MTHLMKAICILVLSLLSMSNCPCASAAFPWTTVQQNDAFLRLLCQNPPVGINIFSHYDATTNKVPDARGVAYDVELSGSIPVVTKSGTNTFGAVNPVTSLYGDVATTWTWPTLPGPAYTMCWVTRNNASINWQVACFTGTNTSTFTYVVDQTNVIVQNTTSPPIVTASDNYVHSTYTWNTTLSNVEMKVVTRALRKELGGVPDFGTEPVVPISDLRAYHLRLLIALRPPQSINIFADLDGTTIRDRASGMFPVNATMGTVSLVTTTGRSNGADNTITALRGGINTTLLWPVDSIAVSATVCSVQRYSSTTNSTPDRILQCFSSPTQPSNWLHGHASNERGLAFWNTWTTRQSSTGYNTLDWLVMCASSGVAPDNAVVDQMSIGTQHKL